MTRSRAEQDGTEASGVAGGVEVAPEVNEAADGALTVHPRHPTADDVYFIGGAWAPAAITAQDKRFSDAELAAEYWLLSSRRERMLGYDDGPESETRKQAHRDRERMNVVQRFATLPHFDQEAQ